MLRLVGPPVNVMAADDRIALLLVSEMQRVPLGNTSTLALLSEQTIVPFGGGLPLTTST